MPQQTLDNDLRAELSVQAKLEQSRAAIRNALTDAATKQIDQQQKLGNLQKNTVGNLGVAKDPKVAEILVNQSRQLEANQKYELALNNQGLASASRLETGGPDGPWRALQMINAAEDLKRSIGEGASRQRTRELDNLKKILAVNDARERKEQLDELLKGQKDGADLRDRDAMVARDTLERRESLMQNNMLGRDDRDRLLAATKAVAASDQLKSVLTADAMQRMADEALHPGQEPRRNATEENTVQSVKGLLAEMMTEADARRDVEQENETRADRRLYLIEGSRIRNEQGKLSDGLVVWRDADDKLKIWRTLEVKSGERAAREFRVIKEDLSQKDDKELRAYAKDVARDAVEHLAGLSLNERKSETERLAREGEVSLRSYKVQKEPGQPAKTAERLDVADRIYIDGHAYEVERDKEQCLHSLVQSEVPNDVRKKDVGVRHLDVTSQDINNVAHAFVEELLRQRKMV